MGLNPEPYDDYADGPRREIVDERCKCGELLSKHGPGHCPDEQRASGRCPDDESEYFRWAAFVLSDGTDLSNEVIPW